MTVSGRVLGASISIALLALALNTGPNAAYAFSEDKNWPCVQRKVPKLSAGQMWRGDPVDIKDTSWKTSKPVNELISKIMPRRTSLKETDKLIAEFAKTHKESYPIKAKQIFLGLLEKTNTIRTEIITGIGKFSSRQKQLVETINNTRQRVSELDTKDKDDTLTKEEDRELTRLEQKLEWDIRIHEEREKSLQYVCESPVILEQRLFELSKQLLKY